jgi:hypothetical protein
MNDSKLYWQKTTWIPSLYNDEGLPDWMTTNEMRQAMSTLSQFSEKERDYHAYQARQNYLRQQRTIQFERDELEQQLNEERKEKEAERRAKEQALAERVS